MNDIMEVFVNVFAATLAMCAALGIVAGFVALIVKAFS